MPSKLYTSSSGAGAVSSVEAGVGCLTAVGSKSIGEARYTVTVAANSGPDASSPAALPPSPSPAVHQSRGVASLLTVIIVTGGALMFYFVTSIALTVFNKWLFTEAAKSSHSTNTNGGGGTFTTTFAPHPPASTGHAAKARPLLSSPYGFHFPLTVTCIHQAQVFFIVLLGSRVRWFVSRVGQIEKSSSAFWTLVPIGAFCGLDWGLSNTSMRSIPLSLYEMVKSSTPVVVLLFSFRLGLSPITPQLVLIILLISVGLFLSVSGGNINVFKEDDFPFKGFMAVCVATLLSGTRVVLTQFALQRGGLEFIWRQLLPCLTGQIGAGVGGSSSAHVSPPSPSASGGSANTNKVGSHGGFNTMTALYYCAPASALALVLPAVIFEGSQVVNWFAHASRSNQYEVIFWVTLSSVVAFLLTIAELTITGLTSALTLCVTGIAKQVIIVAIAMVLFGERLGAVNAFGFSMSIVGICFYNYIKYKQHAASQAGYSALPSAIAVTGGGPSSSDANTTGRSEGIAMSTVVSVSAQNSGSGVISSSFDKEEEEEEGEDAAEGGDDRYDEARAIIPSLSRKHLFSNGVVVENENSTEGQGRAHLSNSGANLGPSSNSTIIVGVGGGVGSGIEMDMISCPSSQSPSTATGSSSTVVRLGSRAVPSSASGHPLPAMGFSGGGGGGAALHSLAPVSYADVTKRD